MKTIIVFCAALLLASCALPETGVHTGSPRPTIYIKGAVNGAELFVDGLKIGLAERYDGNPRVLVVEEGAHIIEIRKGTLILHTEKTFVSNGESRMITVNIGGK